MVEGQGVRFYQINLVRLPEKTDRFARSPRQPGPEDHGRARREPPGSGPSPATTTRRPSWPVPTSAKYEVEGLGNSAHQYALRAGPATVRSLEILPAPGRKTHGGPPGCGWSGTTTRPRDAGVDLPLGLAFGVVEGATPYQSLLVGQKAGTWYNRFPMPYHRQAILRIDTRKPLKGTIVVRTTRGVAADAGYFRAAFARPPRPAPRKTSPGSRRTAAGISPGCS